MGKKHSIKKFRDAWEDDEWGSEDSSKSKGKNSKKRRVKEARKQKFSDRWYDEDFNIKRKKSEKTDKKP
jgi:hypothetical protein|tara:strand:+ start:2879 stop:3085 length:207 start_codon:yes stop_codon:yes gene_type:complete